MNPAFRRTIISRRRQERRSLPWWALGLLSIAAMASMGVVFFIGSIFVVYTAYARDYVPIEQMLRQQYAGLTEVYDRGGPENGVFLGTLNNPNAQLLNPVPLGDISPYMVEATIATEDNSFWSHPGVNPRGLVRAAYENYTGGGIGTGSGGSSITQQLVKNVYLSDDCYITEHGVHACQAPRTLDRKLKEIAYAIELERSHSKEQILEWYLNQISYADRYQGVEAAARGYFRKGASELTLAEAALLAGIPAAPTTYHPRLNCSRDAEGNCALDDLGRTIVSGDAKVRQEIVLDSMVAHGRITPEEAKAAKLEPLHVWPQTGELRAAAWIDNQIEPRLVRMCEAGVLPKLPRATDCADSVRNAGYKVTTTLNYGLTQDATALMRRYLDQGQNQNCRCNNVALVTIDPRNGQVMVYAPNIDPTNTTDPKVAGDIDQLVEINQPGSSFKPAVYLAWMELLNKAPMNILWDTSPLVMKDIDGSEVRIVNPRPGGGSEGLISARLALGSSQNVPAFRAAAEAGVDNVITLAQRLGLTTLAQNFDPTFLNHDAVGYGPAIATGGANVRAIDMAYMNAVFANMGTMVGVPTYARTVPLEEMKSILTSEGDGLAIAHRQALDFQRGNIRLPGSRELDPVVVLEVRDPQGRVIFEQGEPQKVQVVEPGTAWLLHSILSDCNARAIIWGCGGSNQDTALDFFIPGTGVRVPAGVKTGTQQGPRSSADTLETWTNGYTRYAATAVWVGNSDNSLAYDGSFGTQHTALRTFKNWMAEYHAVLRAQGYFDVPQGFEDLQPPNVTFGAFRSPTTDRGQRGGCNQTVQGWYRTDIEYVPDCQNGAVRLPEFERNAAISLARSRGIPIRGGGSVATAEPAEGPGGGQAVRAQPAPAASEPTPVPAQPRPAPPPTEAPQPTQPPSTDATVVRPQPTATPSAQSPPGAGSGSPGSGSAGSGSSGPSSGTSGSSDVSADEEPD
jgi:membrane peptidoglycan carboxypeptidase